MRKRFTACIFGAFLIGLAPACRLSLGRAANDPPAQAPGAADHVPASPEEPLAKTVSLERAARSLDASALAWQKQSRPWVSVGCSQCHANLMYLIARPVLEKVVPTPP